MRFPALASFVFLFGTLSQAEPGQVIQFSPQWRSATEEAASKMSPSLHPGPIEKWVNAERTWKYDANAETTTTESPKLLLAVSGDGKVLAGLAFRIVHVENHGWDFTLHTGKLILDSVIQPSEVTGSREAVVKLIAEAYSQALRNNGGEVSFELGLRGNAHAYMDEAKAGLKRDGLEMKNFGNTLRVVATSCGASLKQLVRAFFN